MPVCHYNILYFGTFSEPKRPNASQHLTVQIFAGSVQRLLLGYYNAVNPAQRASNSTAFCYLSAVWLANLVKRLTVLASTSFIEYISPEKRNDESPRRPRIRGGMDKSQPAFECAGRPSKRTSTSAPVTAFQTARQKLSNLISSGREIPIRKRNALYLSVAFFSSRAG